MRALIALAVLPLLACQEEFNEGLSRVAVIEPAGSPLSVSFECEQGPAISVIFYEGGGTATVAALGVGQEVLFQRQTGSGFHYANEIYDLRGQGNEVTWSQTGGLSTICRAVGDRI